MTMPGRRIVLFVAFASIALTIPTNSQWTNWNFNLGLPEIPQTLRGEWYSRERGANVFTTIDTYDIADRGRLRELVSSNNDNYTLVLWNSRNNCHFCMRLLIRTMNILDKIEGPCITADSNGQNGFQSRPVPMHVACRSLDPNQEYVTMFSTNPSGRNCRSSLEGRWKFEYQNQHKFTGECSNPDSRITACQKPGSQFFNENQQFVVEYRACQGVRETQDAKVEYKCLGDWYVGKNHYFAVKNTRETRVEEAYRCFLTNRDDEQYMSVSATAECNVLRSPQQGPIRWRLAPIKDDSIAPKCTLPHNMTGMWINTANFDAEVSIDSSRMVERWKPDSGRYKQETYVCVENRGSRYLMARLGVNGCQRDYVCFQFLKREQNVLRYRKAQAVISDNFATACSWSMFDNQENWIYDVMVAKNPASIKCPVAGKFKFDQIGDVLFENRTRGGIAPPKPNVYCKKSVSDLSACGDQKKISIEPNYCISVDQNGRPVDIYGEPDYELQCIAFWRENLHSYLITYDPVDAYSRYRCWVYQRTDQNKIAMSMSVGAYCHVTQTERSSSAHEGAQVALSLVEYEREADDCPMHFDDGTESPVGANRFVFNSNSAIITNA